MTRFWHKKTEYLKFLIDSPDGLTPHEASLRFDNVDPATCYIALRRLHLYGLAKRFREYNTHRYVVTLKGRERYVFLIEQEEAESDESFEEESDETEEDVSEQDLGELEIVDDSEEYEEESPESFEEVDPEEMSLEELEDEIAELREDLEMAA